MFLHPVTGDVGAGRDPDPVMLLDVVQETLQAGETPRPADQAAMQADRHHLRRGLAFGVEHVEGIAPFCYAQGR